MEPPTHPEGVKKMHKRWAAQALRTVGSAMVPARVFAHEGDPGGPIEVI